MPSYIYMAFILAIWKIPYLSMPGFNISDICIFFTKKYGLTMAAITKKDIKG